MNPSNIIHSQEYDNLPVRSCSGLHSEILARVQERLSDMTRRHSQVFVSAFVIQFPENVQLSPQQENQAFSQFMASFIRSLKQYDPSYIWVREECPAVPGRFHFHLVLILNGNESQNSWGHLLSAQKYWSRTLGIENADGLVHLCQPFSLLSFNQSGFKIVRSSPDFQMTFNETFNYLSYLAKVETKSPLPGVRSFGCSELN